MKLSQLRALVAVAEVGNFSEAALRLDVSQSAVSHAIAALEGELGVVLFSRGRHGARLTPIGERVKAHAEDMLKLLDVIGKEANLTRGLKGGQVRVGVFRSVATRLLPEVIVRLKHYFPDITLTPIEYRDDDRVEQALREGRIDVGFTCIPISESFEGWKLMRDEYVVLLPFIACTALSSHSGGDAGRCAAFACGVRFPGYTERTLSARYTGYAV
ncbi:MAG: LysR family transcriptional regulator [Leptolyngbyaceae cyanobacterium RM1_406_9]|nr:LysR family transcriptional regulator [Leptolyngbyaceae cyanobacterium RM1_406_9]